jgi:hypothetical protein
MNSTRPKLVPTIICFAVVGLAAAIIPYPGFEGRSQVISPSSIFK